MDNSPIPNNENPNSVIFKHSHADLIISLLLSLPAKSRPISSKEHIKSLADRFMKAGAEDMWNEDDGPVKKPVYWSGSNSIDSCSSNFAGKKEKVKR
ncbi:unnamed protein product [Arabis nemorensis]|uniref:Uncharacterized protein n=1 Tax=Arabis nemorensis TaxID=586526 RepID=A0A565BK87_9BRAS|nr:unnamed protein product [Arabis nemorensis]